MSSLSQNNQARKISGDSPTYESIFLYPDGNLALSPNANGNYSVTPQLFSGALLPPSFLFGQRNFFIITEIQVDVSSPIPPVKADYGTIVGGLTNGFTLDVIVDTGSGDQTIPISDLIVDNQGLFGFFDDFKAYDWSANDMVAFRSRVSEGTKGGFFFPVPFSFNPRLAVTLNDDFSGLTEHYIRVSGLSLDNPERWGLIR